MSLENDDKFTISRTTEDYVADNPLLTFTKNTTVCKRNPQSCGQILGQYGSASTYYKFSFSHAGGPNVSKDNPIWIDLSTVRQFGGMCMK